MKKIFYLAVLFVTINTFGQHVKMGIIANPQIAWMAPVGTDEVINEKPVFGFDIGLSIEKYFTDNYAILTGISLNNIGGNISYSDSVQLAVNEDVVWAEPEENMLYNFQYVKIPFALKFKTKQMGYFTYFAQIGLEGSVNVRSDVTLDQQDVSDENVSKEINLFNAGYLIGGGFEYSIGGSTAIILGIQYQNGMIDVLKTTDDKVITPRVSLLLGVMF